MEANNQKTILVVDDTPGAIGVVQTPLQEAGYRVVIATSGPKALQRAALVLPDLILLDVIMPGMGGYETCRRLKAQEATREIPVVFFSALTETFDKVKGFRLGAVDYLVKPVASEELLARVRTHVALSRLERELRVANRSLEERVAARTAELSAANARLLEQIAEREQAQESLRRRNRELKAISSCNQLLMRAADEPTLVCEICRIICEEAGYRMAWVGYAEHDQARSVRPVAWAGVEEGYLAAAQIVWADTERGRGPTGTAIRSGTSACIQDFAAEPQAAPWCQPAQERGYRSCIALPLKGQDALSFGALTIYSTEPQAFTPEEVRLLEELGGDLAFGITTLRMRVEHDQAEAALHASEEKYRRIVDTANEGVCSLDLDTRITFANAQMARMLGYSPAELLGRFPADFMFEEDIADHQRQTENRQRMLENYERRLRRKDGQAIWTLSSAAPIFDEAGHFQGSVVMVTDITERKQAEEKITHLAAIIESTDDAVIGKTLDGRIVSWNQGAEQLYGYSAAEIVGQPVSMLVPAEGREELDNMMARLKRGEKIRHFETTRLRKDRQRIHVALTISPIKNAKGELIGASTIARDITERKRIDDLLHQRAQEFQALVENSPDIIARYDRECRRIYLNPAYQKVSGITQEELLGATPTRLSALAPEAAADLQQLICQVIDSGHRGEIDLPMQAPGGEQHWFAINVIPEFDRAGQVASAMTISRDITQRKRAEEEVRRLNQELEQRVAQRTAALELANKELKTFSYSVSHDLRAPLRTISGFSQILLEEYKDKDSLDSQGRFLLERINQGAVKMNCLIEDILAFSRMARAEMGAESVDMTALAHEVFDELQAGLPQRKLRFLLPGLPPALGDRAMLRQVWSNLLGNALKYSAQRQEALIEVSGTAQGNELVYCVKDNGAGFDMQDAGKLFGVFQRLHSSGQFEGTGIGLAIVKRIIERHGGRAWAEGKVNEGATFFFSLPAPRART